MYHDSPSSLMAEENFKQVFQEGNYAKANIPDLIVTIPAGLYKPIEFPIISGATTSTVQAKDLLRSGGAEIDGQKIEIQNWSKPIAVSPGQIIRVGKRRVIKVLK